jgi:hypothetical protein
MLGVTERELVEAGRPVRGRTRERDAWRRVVLPSSCRTLGGSAVICNFGAAFRATVRDGYHFACKCPDEVSRCSRSRALTEEPGNVVVAKVTDQVKAGQAFK